MSNRFTNGQTVDRCRKVLERLWWRLDRALTLEDVREKVKKDLHAEEHQKVMVNWEDELLQTAGFKIYDRILKEMLAEIEDSPKNNES